jgi:hypothetical protein
MSPAAAARALTFVSLVFLAFALVIAAAAWPPLAGPSTVLHDLVAWPIDGGTDLGSDEARLLSAILGGVFASLAAMLMLVVAPALKRGDDQVRRGAVAAVLVWFVIDSIGSVVAGAPSNAAFNTVFLAMVLAPLMLVRADPA